jgi:seryl-tRNA synthetase
VTARALLAILENFQDASGHVAIPEVLQRYGAPAVVTQRGERSSRQ